MQVFVIVYWQIRTKHLLDPSVANVETVCEEVRANGDKMSQGRVVFHYNGHGVLPPTVDYGEIWVFNKRYNKYKPIPISVIHVRILFETFIVSSRGSKLQLSM